jgi:hypothetical protein
MAKNGEPRAGPLRRIHNKCGKDEAICEPVTALLYVIKRSHAICRFNVLVEAPKINRLPSNPGREFRRPRHPRMG